MSADETPTVANTATHKHSVSAQPPLNTHLDQDILARHTADLESLAALRKHRTALNEAIREAVAAEAASGRLARALQPRKRRTSKEMKG